MRRILAIAVTTAATLVAGAPARAEEPVLAAKLASCETGLDPVDRYAVFTGSMPREDADVMAMRFELQQRGAGEAWDRVALKGWGDWIRAAKTGVPGFIYTKRLEQLAAPAFYRAVITFRWSTYDGSVIRTAKRFSKPCRQPDWRADLEVKSADFVDDARSVKVVVRNRGRDDAGEFAVHAARADIVKGQTLAGLPAGADASVTLRVGRCAPGETVTVTVDPAGGVDEADEDDNALVLDCPV
jgi:hypothetical protein